MGARDFDKRNIGERIRELRRRRGMTQRELAEASGIGESALRSYELGVRCPRSEYLVLLASALGVRPEVFEGCGIETDEQLVHALFNLEERFGLCPFFRSVPALIVGDGHSAIIEAMREWAVHRAMFERGEMTEYEYMDWKDSYHLSERSRR